MKKTGKILFPVVISGLVIWICQDTGLSNANGQLSSYIETQISSDAIASKLRFLNTKNTQWILQLEKILRGKSAPLTTKNFDNSKVPAQIKQDLSPIPKRSKRVSAKLASNNHCNLLDIKSSLINQTDHNFKQTNIVLKSLLTISSWRGPPLVQI